MLSELRKRQAQVELGGGAKLQKQRDQGKLTARERIAYLVDPKHPCLEIALRAMACMRSMADLPPEA